MYKALKTFKWGYQGETYSFLEGKEYRGLPKDMAAILVGIGNMKKVNKHPSTDNMEIKPKSLLIKIKDKLNVYC